MTDDTSSEPLDTKAARRAAKQAERARIRAQRAEERRAERAIIREERNAERREARDRKKGRIPLPVEEVAAAPRRRALETGHWVGLISFVLVVALPVILAGWYLWSRAADQYASHMGLTVQQDAAINPADLVNGLVLEFGGQSPQSDTDILFEFLQSPALVATLSERIDLASHYSAPFDVDPVFALRPGATLADVIDYWWRIVYLRYDTSSGLIDVRVQAFDPEMAERIAHEILAEATLVIENLATQAREDAIRFAVEDVDRAQTRLRAARQNLIGFQSQSQILDPDTDIAGRLAIIASLQGDLAEALIAFDALRVTARATDPRIEAGARRIEVIRQRIDAERTTMAAAAGGTGTEIGPETEGADTYPALLAEFQRLASERSHAVESLNRAFIALDRARSNAAQQNRYVIPYIAPTRPDDAVHPKRALWFLAVLGAGLATWFLINVAYVSIRDRR